MPIYICIVRRAQCAMCSEQWDLEPGSETPDRCLHCGSVEWEWGPESRDTRYIRQGISRLRTVLNPGAKSRARQERGRKQFKHFKPKPEEV